jgi:ammonia channel protein AmtB
MLWIIDRITTVKVDEAGEAEGLDMALHGEAAYVESI